MHQPFQQPPVILIEVGEVQTTDEGKQYFTSRFKRGAFGKAVSRTFWSKESNGNAIWDRVSPDDLKPLIGHDISAEVSIEAVEIEREEFVSPTTGEVYQITSKTIVRFSDETLEQAVRRSGSVLRESENRMLDATTLNEQSALPQMPASGAFTVVGLNGRGRSQS